MESDLTKAVALERRTDRTRRLSLRYDNVDLDQKQAICLYPEQKKY